MRENRFAGSYDRPAEYHMHDLYFPVHEMWEQYAGNRVADCKDAIGQSLCRQSLCSNRGELSSALDRGRPGYYEANVTSHQHRRLTPEDRGIFIYKVAVNL
uniref:Uncharacterized protein n=1 Tax=Physcomitrium patens TaxID=3218 RepID=A0A2K1IYG3_PHYPA|nr:hypothetical protein PHYPA_024137 [Physcomitrium patens]